MTNLFYSLVSWIASIHYRIMAMNDYNGWGLTDKGLHFVVIGIIGMLMIFVCYPIFKALADRGHIMVVSWIYVFTLIIVLTFAIEIGQGYTGTGNMEFADIMFGIVGFLVMFAAFAIIRALYIRIRKWMRHKSGK